ncbi:CDP-diacylglycerol--serine O-phosphatidyltransferase [Clostridium tyrobutyricum]|uniref:CDP-diacylglycerol--serine O-phosphatidyltransferase n=1 Tax=Clostridium tyrobutyricum TaxID=1519 RepID=UPI001C3869A2|nr:CDP-diacylglycerol--serine O-phosphatidyltransferase [Clostridium tyrobutyricum]MBV4418366.1 CDP-diacylglycerol--serine O-phosphatidyltransferase [Clostridium tyrobutyricum]
MAKIAKSSVPNAFTLANLACGIMSVLMSFQEDYVLGGIFILLACLADRYDGRVARYLNVSSELGKELDSLADLVSFGVAPSILIFNIYNFSSLGILGYIMVLVLPLSGAYRLAKFNVTEFDGKFFGIPITFAGMFIALFCLITMRHPIHIEFSLLLVILLSYLMVCNKRFKKF